MHQSLECSYNNGTSIRSQLIGDAKKDAVDNVGVLETSDGTKDHTEKFGERPRCFESTLREVCLQWWQRPPVLPHPWLWEPPRSRRHSLLEISI